MSILRRHPILSALIALALLAAAAVALFGHGYGGDVLADRVADGFSIDI